MRKLIIPALALAAALQSGTAMAQVVFNRDASVSATGDARSQTVIATGRNAVAQGGVASIQSADSVISFRRSAEISLNGTVRTQDVMADGANAMAQGGVASIQAANGGGRFAAFAAD